MTKKETKECVADLAAATKGEIQYSTRVEGIDFEQPVTIDDILRSYAQTGFQATNLHEAVKEVRRMRAANAKVFFGCTSNIISSGLRDLVRYMARNKHIDVFVCTGGGIEEDLIKCMGDTYLADFHADGAALRDNGWNRIGNLVIHNDNYCKFEIWFKKFLDVLLSGNNPRYPRTGGYTDASPLILTPSKFISLLGEAINDERSVLYWCHRNEIPVYSPALTDGSIGDMLTFANRRAALKLDIVEDIYNINTECLSNRENGAIVVGCGLVKHHILNANLFNNGLEYCVLVNTAVEYDGSDAGASLNEAVSWGKVKPHRACVKVHGDASIVLPLLVYGGFKSKADLNG